jgi:hypothetical protein
VGELVPPDTPKAEEPPPPPPALRRIVGTSQQTPIGGIFDRFDVVAQPVVAPVNAKGQAFYATILRSKANRRNLRRQQRALRQGCRCRR